MLRTTYRAALLIAVALAFLTSGTPLAARTPPPRSATEVSIPRGSVTSRPYAVMIDNHPRAYPQTGLNQAAIVFEALAEYGITRYMAVYFPGITPELASIGPVRSARTYFVEWARGLRGVYVHAGGAPDALTMAATSVEIVDMDALRNDASAAFTRSADRLAPHNLYTSSARIAAFLARRQVEQPDLREIGFRIKRDRPATTPTAQRFSYYFLYEDSYVSWRYDRATNSYLYFRQQRPHVDAATGEQLRFKNVVVLEVPERPIPGDPKQRIQQDVIGEGPARLFLDGRMIEATWRKGAGFAQLRLFDRYDRELPLNSGPIWFAALPSLENLSVE
ncbi:MAG: DUF3048 domain-containing protein [Chloroflexaceae bacterium]